MGMMVSLAVGKCVTDRDDVSLDDVSTVGVNLCASLQSEMEISCMYVCEYTMLQFLEDAQTQ